ncbi:ROK family protein [Nocardioides sp. TRM66260-LWL]|uniref:ROK family protein n=1 Tax=Nocardioides sp. TRM66260-LWL TaxID=2874478 RepID=UPI001CC45D57|nr:ROK family protein [Nocardioides sp. TRM66260-LWL]MBZ5735153.1 ROK family protein [Nocardioides sp. TRM66260-LWL]
MTHTIGVDVGGTKISAGVVDATGVVLVHDRVDTPAADPGGIEASIADLVARLGRRVGGSEAVSAVGVAAAGFVAGDAATVRFAPNIAWRDHDLGGRLAALTGLPVVVENDANAAGWAEFCFGEVSGVRELVCLTLGTGLGGAIVSQGRLLRGSQGMAAELGHLRVVPDGEPCGCGQRGCWEQYVSGGALTRRARRAVVERPDEAAGLLAHRAQGDPASVELVSGRCVIAAARAGDPLACELVTDLGRWLGEGVATLCAVIDPAAVVVGGGLAAEADLYLPAARAALERALPGRSHRDLPRLVASTVHAEAGIVGAAALARAAS